MNLDIFLIYLSSEKRFSKHTILSYSTDLKQFLNYLSENFSIDNDPSQINFNCIRSFVSQLLEEGLSPRSVNRKISSLKTYFKFLVREELITESPILKIIAPKVEKRLPVFIDENKILSLLNDVQFEDGWIGERNKMIIEMFYLTGMRLSELVNLKKSDVNTYNSYLKVLGKRNKERIIPLPSYFIDKVNKFIRNRKNSHYIFTDLKGGKLYHKLVYRLVKKYIGQICSVNKKSPHILRHTFATHMLNNGADINAIKELLGHANLSATQVYTHNSIKKLKSVYNQAHPRA